MNPRLKVGVKVWQYSTGELRFGTRFEHIALPAIIGETEVAPLLGLCDGTRDMHSISHQSGVSTTSIKEIISLLRSYQLLDTHRTPIPYTPRYNSDKRKIESVTDAESVEGDFALNAFLARCEIESEALSRLPHVFDGGRQELLNRKNFSILIYGSNRISNSLFGVLQASGFNPIFAEGTFTPYRSKAMISSSDISGTTFRNSDIGLHRVKRLNELRTEYALFPEEKSNPGAMNLIICVERPSQEVAQFWMSDGIPFLVITPENAAEISIGPLIKPGSSPCLRCVELSEKDRGPLIVEGEVAPELSSIMSTFSAATIAAEVSKFAMTGSSVLCATTLRYSQHHIHQPQMEQWQTHPNCGCAWR